MPNEDGKHQVVIVGGGFGGLYAAKSLRKAPVRVTLIDRRNFHLFQPLLYQVATGGLSPANIATPLRGIFRRQRNLRVLLANVVDFDPANRRVILEDDEIGYDTLIVAAGATTDYFGHSEWEKSAPSLKSLEDATRIRQQIFLAFEAAERESDLERIERLLTFVVVGAGPTGVELAGTMKEIARDTLKHEFRSIDPTKAKVILLDAAPTVLPFFGEGLEEKAVKALAKLGVEVRTGAKVVDVGEEGVTLEGEGGTKRTIHSRTVVWTAGVRASRLGVKLAGSVGAETDRKGRIAVEPDLSVKGHPEIFVIGDMAVYSHQDGKPLPGIAPVAMQEGRYVADLIKARAKDPGKPGSKGAFRYRDRGKMATIGRAAAVADVFGLKLSGLFAWLAWLFIHLMYLVEFENRLLVLLQWGWNYTTFNRSARLITQVCPEAETDEPYVSVEEA